MVWESYNIVNGRELDLSFKSICNLYYQVYELEYYDYKGWGFDTLEEFVTFLEWLNVERWVDTDVSLTFIKEKDKSKIKAGSKTFDINKDFTIYYVDFIRYYNINLKQDNIDYFTFRELLAGLFSYDDSNIAKVVHARSYTPKEKDDKEYKKAMLKMKELYRL